MITISDFIFGVMLEFALLGLGFGILEILKDNEVKTKAERIVPSKARG